MIDIDRIPISDLAQIIMGQSPKGNTYNETGQGLPLLNGPTEFGNVSPECKLYTTDSKRQSEIGDLIFCVRGSTTGRMNWSDQIYSLGRGVCSIRGKNILMTKYLKYCLDTFLQGLLQLAGGGTFPNLSKDDIANFEVPNSGKAELIASILSAYDDLIENNLKRIKLLEEKLILEYSILEKESINLNEEDFQMYVKFIKGIEPGSDNYLSEESEDTIPFLRVGDLSKRNSDIFIEESKSKGILCNPEDVLVSMDGTIGIVKFGNNGCYSSGIRKAVSNGVLNNAYIFCYLSSKKIQGVIYAHSKGSTIQHASNSINYFKIRLPKSDSLKKFTTISEPIYQLIVNLFKQITKLREARDILLPRLMSGEIEV